MFDNKGLHKYMPNAGMAKASICRLLLLLLLRLSFT
jgi:hypothetical protein